MEAVVNNSIAKQQRITVAKIAFLFWFLYQLSFSTTYLFFQSNPGLGTMFNTAFIVGTLYFLIISYLGRTIKIRRGLFFGTTLLLIFIAWGGCSLFWTPSLKDALPYWVTGISEIMIVLLLCKSEKTDLVVTSSLKGIYYGSLILALVMLTTPGTGLQLGDAQFFHPNVIGNQLAIAAIIGLYLYFSKSVKNRFLFISSLLFMISVFFLTLSKTAILAFGLAFVVYFLKTKLGIAKKAVILIAATSVITVFYNRFLEQWDTYKNLGDGKVLSTFSGRTIIWDMVRAKISLHPIRGYGYFSFQKAGPQPFDIVIGSAHNEFLNIWFNFGIIGLSIAVLIYLVLLKRIFLVNKLFKRKYRISKATLASALLVYFLIRGLTEGHPTGMVFNLPLLLLMMEWLYNTDAPEDIENANIKDRKSYRAFNDAAL